MTAHRITVIKCDGCGTTALPPRMIILDLVNMAVPAPAGVVDARHDARARGWSHSANGKDLCPACGPSRPTRGKLLDKIPHPHWGREH